MFFGKKLNRSFEVARRLADRDTAGDGAGLRQAQGLSAEYAALGRGGEGEAPLELEGKDIVAMVLSGLAVFGPIFLVLALLMAVFA